MEMEKTVATVNGSPITSRDLHTTMQSLAGEQFRADLTSVPEEALGELRDMALSRLLARELIYQSALGEGIVASADEVEAEKNRILRQMGHPKDFWTRLEASGMNEASFLRMLRKDVTVDRATARILEEVPDPDETEIKRFFHEHADKLKSPVQVRVRHILLPADPREPAAAEAFARDLLARATPENFAELARQHSLCPSAAGGGDLGYVRREDLDPVFADAAFDMPVGHVGGPVRTPFGFHLLLVEERRTPAPLTLDEARPNIIKFCRREQASLRIDAWVQTLREHARIETYTSD